MASSAIHIDDHGVRRELPDGKVEHVAWDDLRGRDWHLSDHTTGVAFDRRGDDLVDGLYVELAPWRWHVLRIEEPSG